VIVVPADGHSLKRAGGALWESHTASPMGIPCELRPPRRLPDTAAGFFMMVVPEQIREDAVVVGRKYGGGRELPTVTA